jgi:hypothetical protein
VSLLLNGSTQRLYRHAAVPDDQLFTIMGWVYAVAWGTDISFFYLSAANGVSQSSAQFDATSGNKIKIFNNNVDTVGSTVLATGTWYHFAWVGNGTGAGALKLYLDGVQEVSAPSFGTPWTPTSMVIGASEFSSGVFTEHSNIRIAQARVYDAALTPSEILTERASVTAVRTANINLDTRMNGGTLAACLVDSSGNAHDWTADNTPTVAADPPSLAAAPAPLLGNLFVGPIGFGR